LLVIFSKVSRQIIIAEQHAKMYYNLKGNSKGGWIGLKNEEFSPQALKNCNESEMNQKC
jgi:hypothetical protein